MNDESKQFQKIDIAQISLSLFETTRKVKRGDIGLEADFQRKPKWKSEKKSKLIESIIYDIPIQAIYLSEESDNKYEIIDGQQRIRTIYDFMNDKFKLDSPVISKEKILFSNLEPNIQRKIEDFQLIIFVVKKDNNPNIKFEIFERINTGASKLNSQELRNCIYRNKGIPFIKELSEENIFKTVLVDKRVDINGMQDNELVLRFMSFYYKGYEDYTGNLKRFLNDTLDNYDKYSIREDEFKNKFIQTMESVNYVFGESAFLININKKAKINTSLFEIITYTFSKYNSSELREKADVIKKNLEYLLNENRGFRESLTSATTTQYKTKFRFKLWESVLGEIMEEEE